MPHDSDRDQNQDLDIYKKETHSMYNPVKNSQ